MGCAAHSRVPAGGWASRSPGDPAAPSLPPEGDQAAQVLMGRANYRRTPWFTLQITLIDAMPMAEEQ